MSWSEGRQNDGGNGLSKEKKIDALNSINSVLAMLASDEDLHEDLQLPIVKMAMAHWTGENRLPGDKANKLSENLRVISVLQKVQKLQYVCRSACIAVPLDHLVTRQSTLSAALAEKYLGTPKPTKEPILEKHDVEVVKNKTTQYPSNNTISAAGRSASALPSAPVVTILSEKQRASILQPKKLNPFSSSGVQGPNEPEEEHSEMIDTGGTGPKTNVENVCTNSPTGTQHPTQTTCAQVRKPVLNSSLVALAILVVILAWYFAQFYTHNIEGIDYSV